MNSPYRSPDAKHWAIRLIVAFALLAVSACIIGPKQDDPESASADLADTGTAATDTGRSGPEDTSLAPFDETGVAADVGTSSDTMAPDGGADGSSKTCNDAGDAGDAGGAGEVGCPEAGPADAGGGDAVTSG